MKGCIKKRVLAVTMSITLVVMYSVTGLDTSRAANSSNDKVTISYSRDPNIVSKDPVTINISVSGNPIKFIGTEDGTQITGETNKNKFSYLMHTNGDVTFDVMFTDGVHRYTTASVNNIEALANSASVSYSVDYPTMTQDPVIISVKPSNENVRRVRTSDGELLTYNKDKGTYEYTMKNNGNVKFNVEFNSGNDVVVSGSVMNIAILTAVNSTDFGKNTGKIENYNKISWNTPSSEQPYAYSIFRKKDGESDFKPIVTDKAVREVKVLNLYPGDVGKTVTFKDYNNKSWTLQADAQLKKWMEEPNNENPKGYGKGIIQVDALNIDEFNKDPDKYLKNVDGSYKYNVIYEGAWDTHNYKDLSLAGLGAIKSFIGDNRGYIVGHDAIWDAATQSNRISLAPYINLITKDGTKVGGIPMQGDNKAVVGKVGLLTQTPWDLGEVGVPLNIPTAHTSGQFAMGDVWMKFDKNTITTGLSGTQFRPEIGKYNGETGTSNFYLTTWNNCAVIQTGHSSGVAKPDEEKILANVLFYLAQASADNSYRDLGGSDLLAPSNPNVTLDSINADGDKVDVKFDASVDYGDTYNYYVTAKGQNTGFSVKSNTIVAPSISGVAGYMVYIGPDVNGIPDTLYETPSFSIPFAGKDFYMNIQAVDRVGNKSDTVKLHYDKAPPTLPIISVYPYIQSPVNIQFTVGGSKDTSNPIKYQYQLDYRGLWEDSLEANPAIADEGWHTILARSTDSVNNVSDTASKKVVVDKTPPELSEEYSSTDTSIQINTEATDKLVGLNVDANTFWLSSEGNKKVKFTSDVSKTYEGLQPDTEYTAQVSAADLVGNTRIHSFLTHTKMLPCVLKITGATSSKLQLKVTDTMQDTDASYEIKVGNKYLAESGYLVDEQTWVSNGTHTFVIKGLQEDTVYTVDVVGKRISDGVSSMAARISAKTLIANVVDEQNNALTPGVYGTEK